MLKDRKDEYTVECYPYLGGHVTISRAGKPLLTVMNDYGLMKLGLPPPDAPSFLPTGHEVLLEWWGQLYLLDVDGRRMGLLTDGDEYVLPTPRFRAGFSGKAWADN